jgi:hypothetical protein
MTVIVHFLSFNHSIQLPPLSHIRPSPPHNSPSQPTAHVKQISFFKNIHPSDHLRNSLQQHRHSSHHTTEHRRATSISSGSSTSENAGVGALGYGSADIASLGGWDNDGGAASSANSDVDS